MEWEDIVLELAVGFPQCVGLRLEEEGLVAEGTVEAADDQDLLLALVSGNLAHTTALSCIEDGCTIDLELNPALSKRDLHIIGVEVKALYGVQVFLGLVRDAAEYVDCTRLE